MSSPAGNKEIHIDPSWNNQLSNEFKQPYFAGIRDFLKKEKSAGKTIFPPGPEIFNAYNLTPFEKVKIVIIGQDPYHGQGQAHGLCFSVQRGVAVPPSLGNIYKEMRTDLGFDIPKHGFLESWAKQGVFMLNAILTVEKDQPASHKHIGWQFFTDATIMALNEHREHLVFMLWGAFAQQKAALLDTKRHLVLTAAHPSPFSADKGFFGCKHFSKANEWLKQHSEQQIDWKIPD